MKRKVTLSARFNKCELYASPKQRARALHSVLDEHDDHIFESTQILQGQ